MRIIAMLLLTLALTGCCLAPTSARVELAHVSHISQHVGCDKTNFGYDTVGVTAHWKITSRVYAEAGDGYTWEGLDRRHEVFSARVGYVFFDREH